MGPLRAAIRVSKVIQEDDFQRIFNPIYTILGVNNQLFATLQLIEAKETTDTIGKLFKKMVLTNYYQ